MALVVGLGGGASVVGSAVVQRHRAEAAADLAALAGAVVVVRGGRDPCERVGWVVSRMRVRLKDCRVEGEEVGVEVEALGSGPLARFGGGRATGRAGPVDPGQAVVVER
ncbi:Rv3654c family TadE-like protein [Actinokineospora sp. G85]|uniref:Rv3654c family TadE-like protein n=1 Tax=Actinokineospora sp. G85 TaxID=3406626 RepID=UPI003C793428